MKRAAALQPAQEEVERECGDRNQEGAAGGAERLCGIDDERERHDAGRIRNRDLRDRQQYLAPTEAELLDGWNHEGRGGRSHENRIDCAVSGVEERSERDPEHGGHEPDTERPYEPDQQHRSKAGIPQRHLAAGDKHREPEAEVGEKGERRV